MTQGKNMPDDTWRIADINSICEPHQRRIALIAELEERPPPEMMTI